LKSLSKIIRKFEKNKKPMKQITKNIFIATTLIGLSACDVLNDTAGAILTPGTGQAQGLTNGEVIGGLKEALTVGITNAVDITSVTDGFLGNNEIRLPFPESAIKMKDWADTRPLLKPQADKIVETLNRAAEDASKEAAPIFVNAIKNMSISDGFAILNGGEGAATNFLKKATTNQLIEAFSPKVAESISRVKLTDYWNPVMSAYNQTTILTGAEKVDTDLNDYVTRRAIDGLFHMVEKEENKIRKDPSARVTDLLSKVFGSVAN
jgi:hypothetical protein